MGSRLWFASLACAALALVMLPVFGDPASQDRDRPYASPSARKWLGTDGLGRDVMARVSTGTAISLGVGVLGTLTALILATALGATAGFHGGWRDAALMRLTELFQSLPWVYLALSARAMLPLSVSPWTASLAIALLAGLTGWPRAARVIRGGAQTAAGQSYVMAARGFGASDWYLVRRHVIPDTAPLVLVQGVLLLPQFILLEATLSFVGLGIGEPRPSLGGMLADLRDLHVVQSYPWLLAPAVLLTGVVILCRTTAKELQARWLGLH